MGEGGGLRVGFLGAGKMATALARGWIAAGLITADRCRASDLQEGQFDLGCQFVKSPPYSIMLLFG